MTILGWSVQTLLSFDVVRTFLFWVAIYIAAFWLLWAVANVAYNRRKQAGWMAVLVVSGLALGVVDVVFNWFPLLGPLLFLGFVRVSTLSMRMTKYLRDYGPNRFRFNANAPVDLSWRQRWQERLAFFISYYLVERFATGHIGLEKFGYSVPDNWTVSLVNLLRRLPNPFRKSGTP